MTIVALGVLLHLTQGNSFNWWYIKAMGVRRGESWRGDSSHSKSIVLSQKCCEVYFILKQ